MMKLITQAPKALLCLGLALSIPLGIAACGGGGKSNNLNPSTNQSPVARTNGGQTVAAGQTVTLDGSASSDTDGSISSYTWSQVSGTAVVINNASSAQASFLAPTSTASQSLVFRLDVTDNQSATGTVNVTIQVNAATASNVNVSGRIRYESVGHSVNSGLNYADITAKPGRGLTVQAVNVGNTAIATAVTDASGNYSLAVPPNTNVRLRVRAELIKTGTPSWNVQVVDNTNASALYVVEGSLSSSGTANSTRDLTLTAGWNGVSYTASARQSGPFAILDAIYTAITRTSSVDSSVAFPALSINWSVNNAPVSGNVSNGEIGTSNYSGGRLFILGRENNDTDEFDDHVILHEWGHYFEDKLSRSDSIGGAHGGGDQLDMRVAMGEGFGNALSGILTDDPFYRDSTGAQQASGFAINVEDNASSNPGWYSEFAVQSLLYDLYDSTADGNGDVVSLGWGPLYRSFTAASYRQSAALSSIFSFLAELRGQNTSQASAINTLAANRGVNGSDAYGSGETANAGEPLVLPVYRAAAPSGSAVTLCSLQTFGSFNKLANRQFARFSIAANRGYTFTATESSGGGGASDPDLLVYRAGSPIARFDSAASGSETGSANLSAGDYVLELYNFNNISASGGAPANVCYRLTIN